MTGGSNMNDVEGFLNEGGASRENEMLNEFADDGGFGTYADNCEVAPDDSYEIEYPNESVCELPELRPDWEEYVDPLKQWDDLKFTFTEEEIVDLSKDELMDILGVKTADDVIIYFDLISNIEMDQVFLKDGDVIPIASYEKYYELSNKFARYKMFKLMHDREDTISSLQKAEQKLENMIIEKMEKLENLFQDNTIKIFQTIENEVSQVRDSVMEKVSPAVAELTTIAKNSSRELQDSIEEVNRKIRQLDHKDLDKTIEKLKKVSEMLAEVVE